MDCHSSTVTGSSATDVYFFICVFYFKEKLLNRLERVCLHQCIILFSKKKKTNILHPVNKENVDPGTKGKVILK